MDDIEKVIKGLESCVKADWEVCMNKVCPYAPKESNNFVCCRYKMMADALELLKEQAKRIETLEKVNAIDLNPKWPYVFNTYRKVVLCKDCVNRRVCVIAKKHDGFTDNKFDPDWFCADGERKNNG